MAEKQIPNSYLDLLERPVVVSLATVSASGMPQVTPVWIDYDGTYLRVNSAKGRKKVENMETRPHVTVLAIDPENPYRWLQVQGEVEQITEDGALDHINSLSAKYRGEPDYYKGNPMRGKETRVIFKIRPTNVVAAG